MVTTVCFWDVKAGVIPGLIEDEYSRRFVIDSAAWDGLKKVGKRDYFQSRQEEVYAYAQSITDPGKINWVTVSFVWL